MNPRKVDRTLVVASMMGLLTLLSGQPVFAQCSYKAQDPLCPPASVPANVSINPGGSFDMKVDTFTGSCTACSADSKLRVWENIPLNSDSDSGGGTVTGQRTAKWVWDGPAGTAPGATYTAGFNGDGSVTAGGSASAGWCLTGGTSSASSSGTSVGSGSCTGAADVAVGISTVGGSCTNSTTGTVSGGVSPTPSGTGVSGTVGGGFVPGIGTYANTGAWSINAQRNGDLGVGATTIIFFTKVKCISATSAAANGCVANGAEGNATVVASASCNGGVFNIVNK